MLKRHINLFIKLFLIILLILLFWFILSQGEAEPSNTYVEKPIKTEITLIEPTPTLKPTQTPKPTPVLTPTPKPVESKENNYLNKIKQWEKEYYYVTKTWEYLRQKNFSQEVTCGIIGNMMIETSGGTLDLKPNIYSQGGNYYGLCQWSLEYYPEVKDLPFEQQLDYLVESMQAEFNTFG